MGKQARRLDSAADFVSGSGNVGCDGFGFVAVEREDLADQITHLMTTTLVEHKN
jgi:hypothetical protein